LDRREQVLKTRATLELTPADRVVAEDQPLVDAPALLLRERPGVLDLLRAAPVLLGLVGFVGGLPGVDACDHVVPSFDGSSVWDAHPGQSTPFRKTGRSSPGGTRAFRQGLN